MTSTATVRQMIGEQPVPPPHFSTYPTPCDIARLRRRKHQKLSNNDSYRSLRNDILEGCIEDEVLANLVYFAFDAYIHSADLYSHQKEVARSQRAALWNNKDGAIRLARENRAWAHDVMDLWERINRRYPR